MDTAKDEKRQFHPDYGIMLVPLIIIGCIAATFFIWPEGATNTLSVIRAFINAYLSSWIGLVGIASLIASIVIAASPLGKIKLGDSKPLSRFHWGAIIFTTTICSDVLFYGICEWSFYIDDPYVTSRAGALQDWVPTMSLFHWGPTVWSFMLVLAAGFGFMMYIRNTRSRKLSEACRGLLGRRVDGPIGRIIDILAIFAVYASIASGFGINIPAIGDALGAVFGFTAGPWFYIALILVSCLIYTISAWIGMKSISWFSTVCVWLFGGLLVYAFLFSGRPMFLVETAVTSIGNFLNNFISISTQLDPMRQTDFPQNWTLFYWCYWLTWGISAPFLIAQISGGRTIRQLIVEGYAWGVAGTWLSFLVLGNYGMSLQLVDGMNFSGEIAAGVPASTVAVEILNTLPLPKLVLMVAAIVMFLLLTTCLDSTALVVGAFSEPYLTIDELPDRRIRLFWSILLIVMPIALLFARGSLENIQSVCIIAAFPLSIVLILCVAAFFKEGFAYVKAPPESATEQIPAEDPE